MARIAWILLAAAAIPLQAVSQTASENGVTKSRWALLIGVDEYLHVEPLKYCGADMRALREQLIASGFPEKQVFLLDDKADKNKYKPFKSNIERELSQVLGMVDRGGLVLVAFSGHGVHLGTNSYLCPEDGSLDDIQSLIPLDSVYERLKKSPALLRLMIVDACRNDPRVSGRRAMSPNPGGKAFGQTLESPPEGILLLNSCSPGQISMEEKAFGHGVFTHFLLKGLQGGADVDADGKISLMELYRFANKETKLYVHDKFQEHQTPAIRGELHDDFNIAQVLGRPSVNSLGMSLVYVPAGEFQMGNSHRAEDEMTLFAGMGIELDADALRGEYPRRRVRISRPFWMGAREVTVSQFRQFVDAAAYRTDSERSGRGAHGYDSAARTFVQRREFSWRSPGFVQADDHPAVCVSFNDAQAFVKWLSERERCGYRLPTEAEWEYACRAGSDLRYSGTDDPNRLAAMANTAGTPLKPAVRSGFECTAPGGQYEPNRLGLFDMHGNVGEWCADWFQSDYYSIMPSDDPRGPDTGSLRSARGGSWFSWPNLARASFRAGIPPSSAPATMGFRVVKVME